MADLEAERTRSAGITPWWNAAPVRVREVLTLLVTVAIADATVYHGHGYFGVAVLLAAFPVLLAVGSPRPRFGLDFIVATTMLLVAAIRLAWLGSVGLLLAGFALVVVVGMTLAGRLPFFAQFFQYLVQILPAGLLGLIQYGARLGQPKLGVSRSGGLGVALPAMAVLVFGAIFVMANPDLAELVGGNLSRFVEWFGDSFSSFLPKPLQVVWWGTVAWFTVGLWRPLPFTLPVVDSLEPTEQESSESTDQSVNQLYTAYRNTLVAVIILFALYLVFEFRTLWFREFPDGFYYSGYAHQGAAWLTFALALATVVLSMVFRGPVLQDPRCPNLRKWGWVWSVENGLLAMAVFNRLGIYIQFNGMTRMRVVGVLGICSVIVGFLLVLRKVTQNASFLWLLRRQLWTVCFFIWLYLVLPVDMLVHTANSRWVLAGHPAPAVQISEHPLDASGLCAIAPLLNCDDAIIRDGVRAMYAQAAETSFGYRSSRTASSRPQHWTACQGAKVCLAARLQETKPLWEPFLDQPLRNAALHRFHYYTMQWW
ncbi:DUF4153 domain-containing protein [Thalassoroseus pseudoceratinae]|uniref:DUF4153 domain-containing protein n=1 Tax=Thalassoroseus pseudoceratinae TaxID=2713176 RepID=UPI0014243772|nr:DUF4153 domain-containing protein [Thalassoroseus pseudoceratinae]